MIHSILTTEIDAMKHETMSLPAYEKTLKTAAFCRGMGVHSGDMIDLTILPASVGSGIVFERTDCGAGAPIAALSDNVVATHMCTTLGDGKSITIATVEHLMAALAALGVDNARIQVSGGEIPIMDGSSAFFIDLLRTAGTVELNAPRTYLKILKPIRVGCDKSYAMISPSLTAAFDASVDFHGRGGLAAQSFEFRGPMTAFHSDVAAARTFGFLDDAKKLWSAGLSRGASLDNTVVFDELGVLNDGGLRYDNECARHKVLDAVGDIMLAGNPIIGHYVSHNGGHTLNHQLVQAMLRDDESFMKTTAHPLSDMSIVTWNRAAQIRM